MPKREARMVSLGYASAIRGDIEEALTEAAGVPRRRRGAKGQEKLL